MHGNGSRVCLCTAMGYNQFILGETARRRHLESESGLSEHVQSEAGLHFENRGTQFAQRQVAIVLWLERTA